MNRRQFNQSLMALAAVTGLSALARTTNSWADPQPVESLPRIGLVSVGGADGNTVAAIAQGLPYATRTVAIDTDAFALMSSGANRKVLIGYGADRPQHPRQVYEIARRQAESIEAAIDGFDLLIVLAGMYGAAGKGIAPVLAEIAQRRDIGMVCVAIIPAPWQGVNANPRVREPISQIRHAGATVFPVNSACMTPVHSDDDLSVAQTVRNLCTSIGNALNPGKFVCIDSDDLQLVLEPGGIAAMGFGSAAGGGRIESAVKEAIAHPLLGMGRLLSATGILINVRGGTGLNIGKGYAALREIRGQLTRDPWMLYSVSIDESIGDKVIVSILATVPEAAADIAAKYQQCELR